MRYLESERLLIKPIEEEDIYQLLELRWDKDIMQYSLHEPISRKDQLEWYKSLTKRDLALSIFLKERDSRSLVGTIGLFNISMRHQRAEIRPRLSLEYQGMGIAHEASRMILTYGFNVLNLQRVDATQFRENIAAVKFVQRLGFKKEGLLRRHFYQNGKFRDVGLVGLLKEEFFEAVEKLDREKKLRDKEQEE